MRQLHDHSYHSVDMTKVGKIIRKLHDQVVGQRRRVEITRAGCEDICVMVSKRELESLEQALAILADTAHFESLCQNLQSLLKNAGMVYAPHACTDANVQNAFAE